MGYHEGHASINYVTATQKKLLPYIPSRAQHSQILVQFYINEETAALEFNNKMMYRTMDHNARMPPKKSNSELDSILKERLYMTTYRSNTYCLNRTLLENLHQTGRAQLISP